MTKVERFEIGSVVQHGEDNVTGNVIEIAQPMGEVCPILKLDNGFGAPINEFKLIK